ncbi:MAG TPA: IclR family transcriptional regulator [Ktedonobacteraceae bacterium]|jgi:DNA-binding IclR family transcriptional regulator|nr:IclR family transcriptional regulator [Ktedonobacteraceae bacterium]
MEPESTGEQRENGGVQVIARAAEIMRALIDQPEGLSLAQISRKVGLARSTVHRIVTALEAERFVISSTAGGHIRLGPGLVPLAASVRIELRQEAHPYLEQLSREVNETVDLAILNMDKVLFIDQIAAPQRLQAVSAIGVEFPLHCTANGKAILAELPPGQVERLLPEELQPLTPHTITSRQRLLEELERVRQTRVAYDREEHTLGICAVGATIRDTMGNLAAVTIPLPATRFYGNREKLEAALLRTCERIQRRLGTG